MNPFGTGDFYIPHLLFFHGIIDNFYYLILFCCLFLCLFFPGDIIPEEQEKLFSLSKIQWSMSGEDQLSINISEQW